MENNILSIKVTASVSNLAMNEESKNIVKIYQGKVIKESMEDESGIVTLLNSSENPLVPNSHIYLFPRSFTSSHLSELLRYEQVSFPSITEEEDVPCCEYIGKQIARQISHSFANDVSLREPVFVTVGLKFIWESRVIFSPVGSVPRGASAEVLQRLSEEQSVDSTCSICFENFSGIIIRMPECQHMFHKDCLFKWLVRQNSCPLCR
ncbi:PREDICTED: RING-H2 finger protein ATL77-like [Camelina sativa]|uniref:RING-H2 finger protein ATL77-like n=1 Tax=Camelina sativa TaxID=90675 RepID=A0ABM0V6N4_CAMSA|nr:PREDICTED: RING-H2 finger protein ATL77-like [Camelina sativa]